MRWPALGLLAFLCLLCAGIVAASLVKSRRSTLRYFEIRPRQTLAVTADDSSDDLEFDEFERIADVAYGPHGVRNQLDLYLPLNRQGVLPVIVYIHGGGGEKGDTPFSAAYPLLTRGFAVVQINYRAADYGGNTNEETFDFPAQIEDCKAAIRFLRANAETYRLDGNRIGAMGHSMGGYLSALLCTTSDTKRFDDAGRYQNESSAIQAACSWNGPTDLRTMHHEQDYHAACFSNEWAFDDRTKFSISYTKSSLRTAERASPVTYVSPNDPPILLIAGFDDTLVPPHQANALYVKLRNAGADAELHIVPGGLHDGGTIFTPATRAMAADFFGRHLAR